MFIKILLCGLMVLAVFSCDFVSYHRDYNYYNYKGNGNSKDGFYGSDGEYHKYVPEFGDGVNNWMEENW